MAFQLCALALLALTGVSAFEKLPKLKEYCQLEGVVVEKGGSATTFRVDRGHFSESIRNLEVPDIDFSNLTSDIDSSSLFSQFAPSTRRIYHADTKTLYTWAPGNASDCSISAAASEAPVPRYVELYNSMNDKLSFYRKSTTSVGTSDFDLYTLINPIDDVTRYVVVNPYTGLPYSITEIQVSLSDISSIKLITSVMFTFSFPETVDPSAYVVNETTECWSATVPAPTKYPGSDTCTEYVPPEEGSTGPDAHALPPLPDYCTYSMDAAGTTSANLMGEKVNSTFRTAVVTQDGNCWNRMETKSSNGTVTVEGIYHYGNGTYYSWTAGATKIDDLCTVANDVSASSANPIASYYSTAMKLFGGSFALSEEVFKGERVDVYTHGESVIRVSKAHGFPLYIKYSIYHSLLGAEFGADVLIEDIKVSVDKSEPRDFTVPVIEGCAKWDAEIPPPEITEKGDLDCVEYDPTHTSEPGTSGEDDGSDEDGGVAVGPSAVALLLSSFFLLVIALF